MNPNPNSLPGSDLLKAAAEHGAAPKKEFFSKAKPGGGGLGRGNRPVDSSQDADEDLVPEKEQPPEKKPIVTLSNPSFAASEASFEEKVGFSVDAALPVELKNITRVSIALFAPGKDGKNEQVYSGDFHIDQGKVNGEIQIRKPENHDESNSDPIPYHFTAKHRDSKEVQSPNLNVSPPKDVLTVTYLCSPEIKDGGYSLSLASSDGSIKLKLEMKSEKKGGEETSIKFEGLKPSLKYTLDVLDANGKTVDTLFQNAAFGEWEKEAS